MPVQPQPEQLALVLAPAGARALLSRRAMNLPAFSWHVTFWAAPTPSSECHHVQLYSWAGPRLFQVRRGHRWWVANVWQLHLHLDW